VSAPQHHKSVSNVIIHSLFARGRTRTSHAALNNPRLRISEANTPATTPPKLAPTNKTADAAVVNPIKIPTPVSDRRR